VPRRGRHASAIAIRLTPSGNAPTTSFDPAEPRPGTPAPQRAIRLFRLIDWLMELPDAIDEAFWEEVDALQKEQTMPFVTTPQRVGIRKGLRQAIEDVLHIKFGDQGAGLMPQVNAIHDADKLRALHKLAVTASRVEEVSQACAEAAAPTPAPKAKARRSKRGHG
jgi:hypothetical protein